MTLMRIIAPLFTVLLAGCYYPLGDWESKATIDAPWAAPDRKAVWQTRPYGFFIVPASIYRYRWVADGYQVESQKYAQLAESYLRTTPEWKTWPDYVRDSSGARHKRAPFHQAALVSVNPDIFVLWKEDATLLRQSRLGYLEGDAYFPFTPGWTLGVTRLPEVKELWWLSPTLKRGPMPVDRIDDRQARISWEGGRLLLTRAADGWHVTRD